MIDDVAAVKPLQNVVALLADGEDLDRLALGEQLVGMLAGELGDLRIEAAAQTALGAADDEEMRLVACRCRRARAGASSRPAMDEERLASTVAIRSE